jgi:hypothetical protein
MNLHFRSDIILISLCYGFWVSSQKIIEVSEVYILAFTDFLISAAVAEFKGPEIFGVARLAQVNMELARIEANFSGLSPGKHGWSINEFGDLTRGGASTGKVFNPENGGKAEKVCSLFSFSFFFPSFPTLAFSKLLLCDHHQALVSTNLTLPTIK